FGDRLIAERDARIADLEELARRLSSKVVQRDRELRSLRDELATVRAAGEEGLRSLASVGRQFDELHASARGQATRIPRRPLRDAAELSERLTELARRPGDAGGQLIEAIQDAVRRVAEAEDPEDPSALVPADANGASPQREPQEVFEGEVKVEVGPLSDFKQ